LFVFRDNTLSHNSNDNNKSTYFKSFNNHSHVNHKFYENINKNVTCKNKNGTFKDADACKHGLNEEEDFFMQHIPDKKNDQNANYWHDNRNPKNKCQDTNDDDGYDSDKEENLTIKKNNRKDVDNISIKKI